MNNVVISFPHHRGVGPVLVVAPMPQAKIRPFMEACEAISVGTLDLAQAKGIGEVVADPKDSKSDPTLSKALNGVVVWIKKVAFPEGGGGYSGLDIQGTYHATLKVAHQFFGRDKVVTDVLSLREIVRNQHKLDQAMVPLELQTAKALLDELEAPTPPTIISKEPIDLRDEKTDSSCWSCFSQLLACFKSFLAWLFRSCQED